MSQRRLEDMVMNEGEDKMKVWRRPTTYRHHVGKFKLPYPGFIKKNFSAQGLPTAVLALFLLVFLSLQRLRIKGTTTHGPAAAALQTPVFI